MLFREPKIVPNEKLSAKKLPDPDDERAVARFAMSFDGYEHYGSFEAAAAAARRRERQSLTDLRHELFMSFRGSRHRGDDEYLSVYRELLPLFRTLLAGPGE